MDGPLIVLVPVLITLVQQYNRPLKGLEQAITTLVQQYHRALNSTGVSSNNSSAPIQ